MQITLSDCARGVFTGGLAIVNAVIWTGRTVIWLIGKGISGTVNTIKYLWNLIDNNPYSIKKELELNEAHNSIRPITSFNDSFKNQTKKIANVEADLKSWLAETHYPERVYNIDWSSNDIYMFGVHDQHNHFPVDIINKLKSKGLSDSYNYLSNYYVSPVVVDGETFKSLEHYYQANKFKGQPLYNEIKNARDPDSTRRIVQQHGNPRYPGTRAIEVMKKGLWAKYIQPDGTPTFLGEKLLQTKGLLIEGNKRVRHSDKIWGAEFDNNWSKLHGRNQLGYMLMEIRERLRSYQQ